MKIRINELTIGQVIPKAPLEQLLTPIWFITAKVKVDGKAFTSAQIYDKKKFNKKEALADFRRRLKVSIKKQEAVNAAPSTGKT